MKLPQLPLRSIGACVALLAVISFLGLEPPGPERERLAAGTAESAGSEDFVAEDAAAADPTGAAGGAAAESGGASGAAGGAQGTGAAQGAKAGAGAGAAAGSGATAGAKSNLRCAAGANGGATDKGVTGNRIKLAATNVRSGVGSSFLGTSYIGMQAVVNRVNAKGGICGRLLDLRLVDDGWEAARGANYIQNFAKDNYFALPVVPSSEGLTQAISIGTIDAAGIPVVGSDGMLKEQYDNAWVWPVATSTVSTMRVMVKHAADKGAKTFGIVFDQQYRFGKEGAAAFKAYVRGLTGADPKAFVGITPGRANYSGDAKKFNDDCGGDGCDFVAMLLDPTTANTYISSQVDKDGRRQGFGRVVTGGAQPLFNERFARDCGVSCEGMLVWTGYNPPIGALQSRPSVTAYMDDVRSVDPGVDVANQFLEGAYLGMQVFVAALEKAGPNLTRAGVRAAMDSMTYTSDLSSPLTWGPRQRFANQTAQAFRIVTASGSFAGFAEEGTGF
ncbi:MAG: ABC transporter substrate-binding protein, partial [Actinomycetota bacterium]|nr:ABC transporter substrate-binding protein [Actinomycetota bacterium]